MLESTPLISVIIPVYNAEKWVHNAVSSILSQPCSDQVEVLLVDDGSPDDSGKVCDQLAAQHTCVHTFHKENGGAGSARNFGIEHAEGKYLAFLDSDDWWEREFLTQELTDELLSEESTDLYCFSYQKVSPNKKYIRPFRVSNSRQYYDKADFSRYVGQHHSALLYRADFVRQYGIRYLPTKVWEDVPFAVQCCFFAGSITKIDRMMFNYWMNTQSCMHTKKGKQKFLERYRAEHITSKIYQDKGFSYDLDRIIISVIIEYLGIISTENCYGDVKQLIASEECALLRESDIQPWDELQESCRMWRKNPFLAYCKNRIARRPLLLVKQFLMSTPLTEGIAEYLQFRVLEKGERAQ